MANHPRGRVLIAGGGVGGLAAALAAHRAGAQVAVFERATDPTRSAGTAFNLWGNAVTALERLGLREQVLAAGDRIDRMRLTDHRGRPIGETPIGDIGATLGTASVNIRRSDLIRLLVAACQEAGIPVRLGAALTHHEEPPGGGVVVGLSDRSVERGDVLVGADGARSAVRRALLDDGDPVESSHPIRGIGRAVAGVEPNTVRMAWGPRGGGAGCWPLDDQAVSWTVGTTTALRDRLAGGTPIKQAVLEFLEDFPEQFAALVRSTPDDAIVTSPVLVHPEAGRRGAGPVTLLGDAAHAMPTVFAQGACQALEDAVVLGEELAAAADPVSALRAYERRREGRVAWLRKRVFTMDRLQKVENRLLCKVRDTFTRKAPQDKSVQAWRAMMTFDLTPAG
ncbi:FAD-dependent oxidoreductase [Actinokineospora guangxiensis]|uniref:FAD-dependent oxidoreductase n=1 Tax=Actinokineospora guangxiensis TaxID=1490288 RepID=A0ABW0ESD5_9PSEU